MPTFVMNTASRKIHVFIVLMAVVTAMTWTLGLLDIKYKVESSAAFPNGFPGDTSLWQRAGDWSNVDIDDTQVTVRRDSDERSYAKRTFDLLDQDGRSDFKLRIRGTIKTAKHVVDPADERGAAFMIWLEDDQGEVFRYLTVQEMKGAYDTYQAERIISIPDSVRSFTLVLNSRDSTSSFSLVDASVDMLSVTPLYRFASTLLLCSWLILFVLCVKWLIQHASTSLRIKAGVLIICIIIGVMLPESAINGVVDPLFNAIAGKVPAFAHFDAKSLYKIGHFLFFCLISLVLIRNSRSLPISQTSLIVLLLLLAVASEGMQLHLFNRTTRLSDLGIDAGGILLGWLLATAFKPKRLSRRSRKQYS